MSRVGLQPIDIPQGVTVEVKQNAVTVKGPKGELHQDFVPDIDVVVEDSVVKVVRPTDQKRHKSLHGLYRALIANMVTGVNDGFKKQLELVGVGYRANVQQNILELNLGFSHGVFFGLPEGLTVTVDAKKGQNPVITLEGADKQLVGQVAAKIKGLRSVEPYKGKGVRFLNEQIRKKAGKSASK
jgi:large subunit ribosomal protein L6